MFGFERFTDARVPDPRVRSLFTRENRWQRRLDVEAALALAQADIGVIPAASAQAIADAAHIEKFDLERVVEETATTSHALMPLIHEFGRVVGPPHNGWLHWGAATQNITQTADVLLLRDAHRILLRLLGDILRGAADLAERSAAMPMAGRTHSQHAVAITFGQKVAVWIDHLDAHVSRLERLDERLFCVLMCGAAGTFASFGDAGRQIEAGVAQRLGLHTMRAPSRATCDGIVEFVLVLAQLAATVGKIGRDVYSLMRPEFGEAFEPVPPGTVSSSTMPHKRNPQLVLDLLTISAELRGLAAPALEALMHDHEANGGMTGVYEDVSVQAAVLAADMLARLNLVVSGLELDPARMLENLRLSGGLIGSESLMLALGKRVGRQAAHQIVYEIAQKAATSGDSFFDLLQANPTVSQVLDVDEIRQLLDPLRYTGCCAQIAREMADVARQTADRIADRGRTSLPAWSPVDPA